MPPTSPIVSVIMPVYNAGGYLRAAIESILHQTFTDFEFIIVNDGSTDESERVIQQYADTDHRIRLVSQQNQGLTTTLNTLLSLSRGRYIARMDQDDISVPERLEQQKRYLDTHPDVGLLGSWVAVIDPENRYITTHRYPVTNSGIKEMMLVQNAFAHGAVMMRPDSKIQYRKAYDFAEDFDRWAQLAKVTNFANLPQILYHWRTTPTGMSNKNATIQREAANRILHEYRSYYVSNSAAHIDSITDDKNETRHRGKLRMLYSKFRVAKALLALGKSALALKKMYGGFICLFIRTSP